MKRVIVDYAKLTNEILTLLVDKFPDGYEESDIIRFKNAKNETIEAVEVKTEDTIYLVKVSMKLSDRMVNYDEDEETDDIVDDGLDALKELEIDEDDANDEKILEKSDIDSDADDLDEDADEPADEEEDFDDEEE